jgi:NAD(P)-dependent dehydrogenase (short-subunit alcohol dehydrogenase family)
VVVHCAGGADPAPFLALDDETWDAALELNGSATFRLVQEAARCMVGRPGRIIVISSLCSQLAWAGFAHYCAAKAATDMIVKAAALELAEAGVQINAILPGTIRSQLTERVGMHAADRQRLIARTPAKRLGQPDEVAEIVAWLATSAPPFLTGATIVADGGYGINATP